MKTAALIVIGDEILTGKVRDENSFVFAATMFNQGVQVLRIEVIPDDVEIIAETVNKYREKCNYVCTSGGVGPTHDDKTFAGIAAAFKLPIVEHARAIEYYKSAAIRAGRSAELSAPQIRMLSFPSPCELFFLEPMWLPLLRVENVFVFPGVPFLFESFMKGLGYLFEGQKFFRKILFTDKTEVMIAEDLGRVQTKFSSLSIGSYPKIPKGAYSVMVTVEGISQQSVDDASKELLSLIDGRTSE